MEQGSAGADSRGRDGAAAREETQGAGANPILVEVTRGGLVESRHRGAFAIVDAGGALVQAEGDVERPTYARSAIKPLQAIPLLETGAARRFGLDERHIALACASHGGEPGHVGIVMEWLARIGCTPAHLRCGPQLPSHAPSAEALLRAGRTASSVHNNCSGKHAGLLSSAVHLGEPLEGYIERDHPVQRRVLEVLEALTGCPLEAAPRGRDGCGIPVTGLSLRATARAMARFARPQGLGAAREGAITRIRESMAARPWMVAGTGRLCTAALTALGAQGIVKTGAEGFFTAALPSRGLGIALKIDDGAHRASESAMATLLERLGLLDEQARRTLAPWLSPEVRNRAGRVVGEIRATGPLGPGEP